MSRHSFLAIWLLATALPACADIYKCTSAEGHVSFAAVPCEPGKGETTVQRGGPPLATPDIPREHIQEVYQRAIKNLQIPGKANVKVIEGENYKKLQVSRLPPPTVASQCVSPFYESGCFDPSAGQSSFAEALRRAAATGAAIPPGLPGSLRNP
ncbi:DUF4124 domain-containing protein [Pseudomonas sp. DTU_2021_1001937_2_SI_NGA_ILE_001]|uniref:DUF4124 domain-containing protein n=1 Tax=Pseudomonas sp. DTU_2021_1001937_2_SI_NGA_ILE_001 TaxID=3077589 RepID=UPI0028FC28AD|nr:DUF4124 domain-containing protein [Pseudomonas sp. DTU_2021_1001937_2_SI_NGA_ILE_001]WNW10907.1 DUF4124 domain-containing protein [Pseudomonas sp. DTU_2021_1001937_2_SI_NGA_ILE_001]